MGLVSWCSVVVWASPPMFIYLFVFECLWCSPCWTPSHHVAKNGLEPVIFPFLFSKFWDYSHTHFSSVFGQALYWLRCTLAYLFFLLCSGSYCVLQYRLASIPRSSCLKLSSILALWSDFNLAVPWWSSEILREIKGMRITLFSRCLHSSLTSTVLIYVVIVSMKSFHTQGC